MIFFFFFFLYEIKFFVFRVIFRISTEKTKQNKTKQKIVEKTKSINSYEIIFVLASTDKSILSIM